MICGDSLFTGQIIMNYELCIMNYELNLPCPAQPQELDPGQDLPGVAPQPVERQPARAAQADLPVFFYENEDAFTFHDAIASGDFRTCALMTGPEGGFSAAEVAEARAGGMKICTLGRRILRCETAPLCALSALMFACGEF